MKTLNSAAERRYEEEKLMNYGSAIKIKLGRRIENEFPLNRQRSNVNFDEIKGRDDADLAGC